MIGGVASTLRHCPAPYARLCSSFLPDQSISTLPSSDPDLLRSPWNSEPLASASGNLPCLVSTRFASDHDPDLTPWTTGLPSTPDLTLLSCIA